MLLSLIIAVVFSVLAVFFANDNQVLVQVRMLGPQVEGKLGIVIVVAFGLGAVIGILMMLPAYLTQGWALIRSRRQAEDLAGGARAGESGGTKQV
jgi:uncharacterized membrane protein YciS (DUF1049 family)